MSSDFSNCTHVTPDCPVHATLYGYRPSLGVNSFFAALFAVILVLQLGIGFYTRTWTYMLALTLGSFGELLGYIGRLMMHSNPWNESGLEIEICCLVLAPSFLAAGIYLTLKYIVVTCGEEHSRLKPKLYPRFFIGCDIGSIAIQAIGGGIAASAGSGASRSLLDTGDALIITGISFQVGTMLVFVALAADYWRRRRCAVKTAARRQGFLDSWGRPLDHAQQVAQRVDTTDNPHFRFFVLAMSFAYVTILIRCIYRIHEMAGGWGKPRFDPTHMLGLTQLRQSKHATRSCVPPVGWHDDRFCFCCTDSSASWSFLQRDEEGRTWLEVAQDEAGVAAGEQRMMLSDW